MRFLIFFLIGISSSYGFYPTRSELDKSLSTFAIGSCNKQNKKQPLWKTITLGRPQLFLWLGDIVYGNSPDHLVVRKKYLKQFNRAGYLGFAKATPILGIWDDHDFGMNNMGKGLKAKDQNQVSLLDFLEFPADSPVRSQKGIYNSVTWGLGRDQVKFILLDVRYFRDRPGRLGDILGRKQWKWLKKELKNSKAAIHFFASGTIFLGKDIPHGEEWVDYPRSFKKLFKTINTLKPSGVVFLSGDKHVGTILSHKNKGNTYHEFISSGLTHVNKPGEGLELKRELYGRDNVVNVLNFGQIDINWGEENIDLKFMLKGTNGETIISRKLSKKRNSRFFVKVNSN